MKDMTITALPYALDFTPKLLLIWFRAMEADTTLSEADVSPLGRSKRKQSRKICANEVVACPFATSGVPMPSADGHHRWLPSIGKDSMTESRPSRPSSRESHPLAKIVKSQSCHGYPCILRPESPTTVPPSSPV